MGPGRRAVLGRKRWLASLIVLASLWFEPVSVSAERRQWTVGVPGGQADADRAASESGCRNLGLVRGFSNVYLFERDKHAEGPAEGAPADDSDEGAELLMRRTKRELEAHPSVAWVDPQTPHLRYKRGFLSGRHLQQLMPGPQRAPLGSAGHQHVAIVGHGLGTNSGARSPQSPFERGLYAGLGNPNGPDGFKTFNDELWSHQWYLQDNVNVAHLMGEIELNVRKVWEMGYTGRGVVVSILDDGLEWNHTDIHPNYDPRASWDMNNNRSDPFPRYDYKDTNSHGTRCAGEVAMVANNRKCGVGVAPQARVGGIKCLDGTVVDHIESMSLLHNLDHIDIYSGSWGPSDDGKVLDGPKRLASQALERGTKYGRRGKGALYIWASGNGGLQGDNCNCDGYVNSVYTISVGGVTQQGHLPFYGERCSSTLAVTCSSGAYTERKIVSTDLHNKCTIDYTGTSASAPLAAGVFALVLEANGNLTWRDAQHLTVWTSNPVPIRDNVGWKRNGVGLLFNSRFGFGLMHAKAMVDAALTWQTVPRKSICIVSPTTRLPQFLQSRNMAQTIFISDGCQREYDHQQHFQHHLPLSLAAGLPKYQRAAAAHHQMHHSPTPVLHLEHVQVIVDIEYSRRGNLEIYLISPSGTVSTLLTRRPLDESKDGFTKWPLMSVHFWGEPSAGKWVLIVRDKEGQNQRGMLHNATLILHGTTVRPAHMNKPRVYEGDVDVNSFIDPVLELNEEDIYDQNTFPNEMALARDDTFQSTFLKSVIALEKEQLQAK